MHWFLFFVSIGIMILSGRWLGLGGWGPAGAAAWWEQGLGAGA